MEQIAQTSDAIMAWEDMPDGSRTGWWCKVCQDENKEWLYTTCSHIQNANPEITIPKKEAIATMLNFMNQTPIQPESTLTPTSSNQKPEPSGSTRPLYNEDTYHTPPSDANQP